jgi:hypothetical protein
VISTRDLALMPDQAAGQGLWGQELMAGLASTQLAEEDFLVGLDQQPSIGQGSSWRRCRLSSTTAVGLARRIAPRQWQDAEADLAAVTGRMLSLLPRAAGCGADRGAVTIAPGYTSSPPSRPTRTSRRASPNSSPGCEPCPPPARPSPSLSVFPRPHLRLTGPRPRKVPQPRTRY